MTTSPLRAAMFGSLLLAVLAPGVASPASAAPVVEILSPGPGNVTEASTFLVTGTATPGASVSVNGLLVHVQPDGSWAVRVALLDGTNTIVAQAWDAGGNLSNASVEIEFRDPVLDLELELGDVLDELAATQEDLNRTQVDLAETQADLADALAAMAEAEANLAATQAELEATQADLAEAQAAVDALGERLDGTEAELEDTGALAGSALSRGDRAQAAADLATLLAVLGLAVGAAGVGWAFVSARRQGAVRNKGAP